MLKRFSQSSLAAVASVAVLQATAWLAPPSAAAAEDPTAPLTRAIAAAESSLRLNESQMAESSYRSALLEGWLLIGALEIADLDLVAAQAAYETAASSTADRSGAQLRLALVHLRRDEAPTAIQLLTGLVARHPERLYVRRLLAQALVNDGRPGQAVQELTEAHVIAPDNAEITFNLATGHLRLGEVSAAEELFNLVISQRPIPQTHLLVGRMYGDFRHFDRAKAAFKAALALDPQAQRAHYYLGTIELFAKGRDGLEDAIESFRKALEAEPQDPLINLYLGTAQLSSRRLEEALRPLEIAAAHPSTAIDGLRFLGGSHLGLDQHPEAADKLRSALELSREHPVNDRQLSNIHYQLGLALRRMGSADEAKVHFETAEKLSGNLVEDEREELTRFLNDTQRLESTPDTIQPPAEVTWILSLSPTQRKTLRSSVSRQLARTYLNLGIQQVQAERHPRAAKLFEQGRAIVPDFPQLQQALGAAYFNSQQFQLALEPLSQALTADPGNPNLRRMTGLAFFNAEAYPRAVELLRDDKQRQTNPSLQYAYGLALVRSGQGAEAQRVFDQLLRDNSDWAELHVVMGQAYGQQGNYHSAFASLHRALELKATVAEAQATLGDLYLRQGKLEQAERAFRAELLSQPQDLQSRYRLATVLDLSRQPALAVAELEKVLEVQPDFADARYLLGKILLAGGQAEQASAHLEAAAQLSPEDPNIFYQLGQAYARQDRKELAQQQFEIFRTLKSAQRADGSAGIEDPGDKPDSGR